MSLVLNESLVLAKTRSQDLKSVLRLNCWGSGIKDVSLVRELINVEVIGLSCNEVTTLQDFAHCKKLKELILRKNKIKNIAEIAHLQGLPKLTNLWLDENPCVESTYNYRKVVIRALPQLKVLDNKPISREELQEIEELGDEIYEEIPYESSASAGSSTEQQQQQQQQSNINNNQKYSNEQQIDEQQSSQQQQLQQQDYVQTNDINETNYYAPNTQQTLNESHLNDTITSVNQVSMNESMNHNNNKGNMMNTSSRGQAFHQSSRSFSSQGSMNALNSSMNQQQTWSISNNNNNNNNMLPKGGKSRNGNILSAVLCLVKELDYTSCEVVQTALHCRMEETSQ